MSSLSIIRFTDCLMTSTETMRQSPGEKAKSPSDYWCSCCHLSPPPTSVPCLCSGPERKPLPDCSNWEPAKVIHAYCFPQCSSHLLQEVSQRQGHISFLLALIAHWEGSVSVPPKGSVDGGKMNKASFLPPSYPGATGVLTEFVPVCNQSPPPAQPLQDPTLPAKA